MQEPQYLSLVCAYHGVEASDSAELLHEPHGVRGGLFAIA